MNRKRLTDEQVYLEYCELLELETTEGCERVAANTAFVTAARRIEPRINSGVELIDWMYVADCDSENLPSGYFDIPIRQLAVA